MRINQFSENGFCCNGAWYMVEEVKGLNSGGVSVNLLDKTNRLRGIARLDLEEGLKAYLIVFARYQDIKYGVLPG